MRIFLIVGSLVSFPLPQISQAKSKQVDRPKRECSTMDYAACQNCSELKKVTDKITDPNEGDYYSGNQWNALFASYFRNCLDIGEDLLKRGANPNWGGAQGSMILTVSDSWPHNNISVNLKWADLLLKFKANANQKIPNSEDTTKTLYEAQSKYHQVKYPEIWKKFQ